MFADEFKHEVGGTSNVRQRYCWRAGLDCICKLWPAFRKTFRCAPRHSFCPEHEHDGIISEAHPISRYEEIPFRKDKEKTAAIYNKQVYGYLKFGVLKFLMATTPNQMIMTMEDTFHTIKH